MPAQILKVCRGCFDKKPIEQFVRESRRRTGYGPLCLPCGNTADQAKRDANPELYRKISRRTRLSAAGLEAERRKYVNGGKFRTLEQQFRKRYAIDFHDWALMYERQSGRCGVCENVLTFDRMTHVDHDHTTGRVRGLLCHRCNILSGYLDTVRGDKIAFVHKALTYLGGA